MKLTKYIFLLLILIAFAVWTLAFTGVRDDKLHIIACDVGQGDAILVIQENYQLLIDGGPNDSVIACLDRYIPIEDRVLEAVVLTHPDKDHYGGLDSVLDHYKVETFIYSGLESSSDSYQVLKNALGGMVDSVMPVSSGQVLRLGLIYLDIYNPQRSNTEDNMLGIQEKDADKNEYSVVINLRFGEFDALLTGDLSPDAGKKMVDNNNLPDVEYIKVSHHGSKNGLDEFLLSKVKPEIAVISVGKNSYGHPHPEVLDLLSRYAIETFRTDIHGDIEVISDGNIWWVEGRKK